MKFDAINPSQDALIVQICYIDNNIPTYDLIYDFSRFSKQQEIEIGVGLG